MALCRRTDACRRCYSGGWGQTIGNQSGFAGVTFTPVPIPEPSSLILAGMAGICPPLPGTWCQSQSSPYPPEGWGTGWQENPVDPDTLIGKETLFIEICSIATGADSKIARQEQGESTWDPLNASELAPNSANGLIPSLIAWAKSQPPGNVAILSVYCLLT